MEYRIYNFLYQCVKIFYNILCQPYKIVSSYINGLLVEYFKQSKNITLDTDYNLKVYLDHYWIPTLEKQLKKM